jgi:methylornithine synthase
LLRIMYPYALIPASLDVDGIAGLRDRLNAGANVVTSIIPPASGLMGVAQSSMDVDEGGRTVAEASKIIVDLGLEVGTTAAYKEYLTLLKGLK